MSICLLYVLEALNITKLRETIKWCGREDSICHFNLLFLYCFNSQYWFGTTLGTTGLLLYGACPIYWSLLGSVGRHRMVKLTYALGILICNALKGRPAVLAVLSIDPKSEIQLSLALRQLPSQQRLPHLASKQTLSARLKTTTSSSVLLLSSQENTPKILILIEGVFIEQVKE